MAAFWDKALFDQAYAFNAEPDGHPADRPPIYLHYNRYVMFPEMLRRAQAFVQRLGITPAMRVLIVGCGYGWTAEALVGMGFNCIGTDISDYIHTTKALSEDTEIQQAIQLVGLDPTQGEGLAHFNRLRGNGVRTNATVLNEDSGTAQSRNRVKAVLGGVNLLITEDLVTSLTDSECLTFRAAVAKYGVPMCHFVTELANPNPPFSFNSKTLAEWKALFPSDTIIADGSDFRML